MKTLEDKKPLITDAAKVAQLDASIAKADASIAKAKDRIKGLESGFPHWNNRITNYPAIWNADGSSKVPKDWRSVEHRKKLT